MGGEILHTSVLTASQNLPPDLVACTYRAYQPYNKLRIAYLKDACEADALMLCRLS